MWANNNAGEEKSSYAVDGPLRKMSKTREDMDEVIGIDLKKCNPSKDLAYDRLE